MSVISPFSALFEKGELDVPAYLTLLNFTRDAHVAVERIRRALASEEAPAARLLLFETINWRPHLVGAVAIIIDGGRPEDLAAMWHAVDRGSWVAPQLVATAALRDPNFLDAARDHIRGRCRLVGREWGDATPDYNPKTLSALLALGAEIPELADECARAKREPDVVALLANLRDDGAAIALDWKKSVETIR